MRSVPILLKQIGTTTEDGEKQAEIDDARSRPATTARKEGKRICGEAWPLAEPVADLQASGLAH